MTKAELISYIKRELGSPKIQIEIDDTQIADRIEDAYSRFIEVHYDGTTEGILVAETVSGQSTIYLPDTVQTVREIFPMNILNFDTEPLLLQYPMIYSGFEFYSGSYSVVDSYIYQQNIKMNTEAFEQRRRFNFNSTTKKFALLETPTVSGEKIGLHCYISEELDDIEDNRIYNNRWFKQYCVALTGIQWASNISKYGNAPLPGGATINYDIIESRYTTMKEELETQLIEEYSLPIDPMVG